MCICTGVLTVDLHMNIYPRDMRWGKVLFLLLELLYSYIYHGRCVLIVSRHMSKHIYIYIYIYIVIVIYSASV